MQIFKNFPGEHASDPLLESFLVLRLLKTNSAKKLRLKSDENWCPSLKKTLITPLTWNIFKEFIYASFRV